MSDFMPDEDGQQSSGRTYAPPKGPEEYLSPEERKFLARYLSFPEDLPPKFKSWVLDHIAVNVPQIPLSQVLGFKTVKDYVPVWTASVTNPVLGNGTITGRFAKVGPIVLAQATVTMGSATTFGSGIYYISLPVSASTPTLGRGGSFAILADASAGTNAGGFSYLETSDKATLWCITPTADGFITPTNPWTWATSDVIRMQILYESG